jgi:tetratricopeptide (TPR) repeat protein
VVLAVLHAFTLAGPWHGSGVEHMRFIWTAMLVAAWSVHAATDQPEVPRQAAEDACIELNQHVVSQAKEGRFVEAEQALSDALAVNADRVSCLCAGLAWTNLAALASFSGRSTDSERLALRSVAILEKVYPREDPVLLRPLFTLAAARVEQGKTAMARQTLGRMKLIRTERPADSALVHGIGASLLQLEGKAAEAIAEVLAALSDWEQAGRGGAVDAAAALTLLGTLYLQTQKWAEAQQVLDRAAEILNHSPETVTTDLIKLLFVQGVLRSERREWIQAERDFAAAIAIADREQHVDPATLRPIFASYVWVLRKNHRRVEARAFETRAAALGSGRAAVVDLSELGTKSKPSKK